MFVLTNTAGASATTPAASKTTLFVDASGVPSTKSSAGTVTPLLTGPAAAAAYQPLDADLTGIAGLTYAADKSIYYTGSAWATYDLTGVGRTLLAATTQAAQRTAIQAVGVIGAENIAGEKTFTDISRWNLSTSGTIEYALPAGVPGIIGRAGDPAGGIAFQFRNDLRFGSGFIQLLNASAAGSGAPTRGVQWDANYYPVLTNSMSCGRAGNVWTQFFATNTTISTSDARLKTEPRQLSEAERKAGSALARLPAIWEWLTGDRLHAGPTVQAAMAVMEAHGLDPFAYSFICYDEWEAESATYDYEGNELTTAREAGDRYSFRKEELLCFMVSALAAENDLQAAKVEALDARLAALEANA
ncbi:TPA: tail fiber domain-containing protein [Stenotrophomonas maltophilia]